MSRLSAEERHCQKVCRRNPATICSAVNVVAFAAATSMTVDESMTDSISCSTASWTVVTLTCRTGQVDMPLRKSCWHTKYEYLRTPSVSFLLHL